MSQLHTPTPDEPTGMILADPTGALLAPLVVGLVLWIVAEGVRSWWAAVGSIRTRRRKIISLMGRAVALQARAMDDGRFDLAFIEDSEKPLSKARQKYDDLTAQALDLFESGEEVVAFWTAAEFYAGWYSPLEILRARNIPRQPDPEGWALLSTNDLERGWMFARPAELASWAQVRWPWDRGNARGPRYADIYTAGDRTRHPIVIPNSDVNMDMLRPFILYLADEKSGQFSPPSPREERRLNRLYNESNASHQEYRDYLIGQSTAR